MNPHQKNKIDVSVSSFPRPCLLLQLLSPHLYLSSLPLPPTLPPQAQRLETNRISHPVQTLSPEEQRLFRLYGKLPSQASVFARNNQRKYFDSGDYALNKAGKGDGVDTGNVGSIVPDVDTIRHNSPAAVNGNGTNNVPGGGGGAVGGGGGSITPTLTKSGSISGPSSGIPVGSPAKESSLQRETSVEEAVAEDDEDKENATGEGQGIPIRT